MGHSNVLIGICWEHGQYRVSFQKTIFPRDTEEIPFQEVEISPGYCDKMAILSEKQVGSLVSLISNPDDRKALSEEGKTSSFFLLHQAEL